MNDTEARLRDYFEAMAATVSATARGPALTTEVHRRQLALPMILTAAAVAAVLVLTVTFVNRVSADAPSAASTSVVDASPQVPYIVNDARRGRDRLTATLYDGSRTVRLPNEIKLIYGRVGDGWLTQRVSAPGGDFRAAILQPNGALRTIGPSKADMPVLSPDRREIAVMTRTTPDGGGRFDVIDVASGVYSRSKVAVPRQMFLLHGWNQTGVWGSVESGGKAELFVWRPGQSAFEPVRVNGFTGSLAVSPATDTVAVATAAGNSRCVKAGALRDGKFNVERQHCASGQRAVYAVLSDDGKTMLYSERKLAIDVASGKTTQLKLVDPIRGPLSAVFEDATRVLAVTQHREGNKYGPQRLYRCDVASGECTLLRTEQDKNIVLTRP
ncbi:hypothetical protein GCM10029976_042870 [Kribbella albertanoniae]|uniref:WD40 repeat domain-containing protein n=1 Tax=Kribbella albertanoniae TaxID=1266829 RepID=A0A4R4Q746_9ACTN|nr:hypothetical protein [Kribbella albertanoniae]TDC30984.1 hypothetical protein E1261_12055 [Kribbella albertanoniae]